MNQWSSEMKQDILSSVLIGLFFISCSPAEKEQKNTGLASSETAQLEMGKQIAMQTQKVLGKNLIQAISTKGIEYALSFCSIQAIPLTDSMSSSLDVQIRRVSDQNRNPNNKANTGELKYINESKQALSEGKSIESKLSTTEHGLVGYYPIMTNGMCLQCHGQPTVDILPNTYAQIKKLYPNDLAVGYHSDALRGIWVIEMNDK